MSFITTFIGNPITFLNVTGIYDATTGIGSAIKEPAPGIRIGATKIGGSPGWFSLNRQTGDAYVVPFGIGTVERLSPTHIPFNNFSITQTNFGAFASFQILAGLVSTNNGHIYVSTLPNTSPANPYNGSFIIYQSFSDEAPTLSNPWPGAGNACALATLGNDVYGVDSVSGLYVMIGDGPAISLADAAVTPINAQANFTSFNPVSTIPAIIGDEINGGIWLMYATHVDFWDPIAGSVTSTIAPIGATGIAGICLDEAAAFLYALDGTQIWKIDAVGKTVTGSIDISSVSFGSYGHVIQVHNNTIWLNSLLAVGLFYSVDATTGLITTVDHSADFSQVFPSLAGLFIVLGGKLYFPAFLTDVIVQHGAGPTTSFDGTGTIFTDTTENFVTDGVVVSSDYFVENEPANPDIPFVSVASTTITFGFNTGHTGPFPQPYLILRTFPYCDILGADSAINTELGVERTVDASLSADSSFTGDLDVHPHFMFASLTSDSFAGAIANVIKNASASITGGSSFLTDGAIDQAVVASITATSSFIHGSGGGPTLSDRARLPLPFPPGPRPLREPTPAAELQHRYRIRKTRVGD